MRQIPLLLYIIHKRGAGQGSKGAGYQMVLLLGLGHRRVGTHPRGQGRRMNRGFFWRSHFRNAAFCYAPEFNEVMLLAASRDLKLGNAPCPEFCLELRCAPNPYSAVICALIALARNFGLFSLSTTRAALVTTT